jgi:anaerobic selenocysteine-containing dehydrogenase
MPDTSDGRRKFLKTALISAGAVVGAVFARKAAYASVAKDPLVRDMANRSRNASIGTHDDMAAALCNKAACNPGCDSGCSAGCQTSCKPGNK